MLKFVEAVGFDIKPSGISIISPVLPHKHSSPQLPDVAVLHTQEKPGSFYDRFPSLLKEDNLGECVSASQPVVQLGFK